jgi:hypothetical protein
VDGVLRQERPATRFKLESSSDPHSDEVTEGSYWVVKAGRLREMGYDVEASVG